MIGSLNARTAVLVAALTLPLALPVGAQSVDVPALICSGNAPDWRVEMAGSEASFTFGRTLQFSIPQMSVARGAEQFPMAATLIADFYTAIVVVDTDASCAPDQPFKAHVLTQEGQTPILLTGCCTRPTP